MKHINILLITITFSLTAYGQTNNTAAVNLKKQADQMAVDFNKRNLTAFAKYTHRKIIKMIGGEANMVALVKKEMDQWTAEGITIDTVFVGDVTKIVKAGTELHSIIKQKLILKVPGGVMTNTSYLLAVSADKGMKWYFVDSSPLDKVKVKRVFPNFNEELVIPAKEEPVFTPVRN